MLDTIALGMQTGIRQLRPEVKSILHGYHRNPNDTQGSGETRGALDEEAMAKYQFPIVPEFSTMPLPRVEKMELKSGFTVYRVADAELGARGAMDVATARMTRGSRPMVDAEGRTIIHATMAYVRRPAGIGVVELLVHRPSFGTVRPEMMVYQYIEGDASQEAARESQPFPVECRPQRVGPADRASLEEIPKYGPFLRYAIGKVGWDPAEFDVWRVLMPYPIINSCVRIFFCPD